LGQHDHLDGLLGKPLEHRSGRKQIETNLSGPERECGKWLRFATSMAQSGIAAHQTNNQIAVITTNLYWL